MRGRRGKFEHADGGTLFLDEVSDLSMAAQAKLLRAIQELAVERVGGNGMRRVDVRIVAASNRALAGLVTQGPKGAFSSAMKAAFAPPFATAASTSASRALPSPPWIKSSTVVGAFLCSDLAAFSTSRTPRLVRTPSVRRSPLRKVQRVRFFGI